jgi:hypothetical protein
MLECGPFNTMKATHMKALGRLALAFTIDESFKNIGFYNVAMKAVPDDRVNRVLVYTLWVRSIKIVILLRRMLTRQHS